MENHPLMCNILKEAYRVGDKQLIDFIAPSSAMITDDCFYLACEAKQLDIIRDIVNKTGTFEIHRFKMACCSEYIEICTLMLSFASKDALRENNHEALSYVCKNKIEEFIKIAKELGKDASTIKFKANYARALTKGSEHEGLVRNIIRIGKYTQLELETIEL